MALEEEVAHLTFTVNKLSDTMMRHSKLYDDLFEKTKKVNVTLDRSIKTTEKSIDTIVQEEKERVLLTTSNANLRKKIDAVSSIIGDNSSALTKSVHGLTKLSSETNDIIDQLSKVAKTGDELEAIFRTSNGSLHQILARRRDIELAMDKLRDVENIQRQLEGRTRAEQNQILIDNSDALLQAGIEVTNFETGVESLTKSIKQNIAQQTEALRQANVTAELVKHKNAIIESTKEWFRNKLAIFNATTALVRFYGITKEALKFGHAVERGTTALGNLWDYTQQSIRLGLTPSDYIQLAAQHRQAVIAMGGTNKAFEQLNAATSEYIHYIGDLGETSKFLYGQMTILGQAGIRPSAENLGLLSQSFKDLQVMVGMTSEEFNAHIADLTSDLEIRSQLQALNQEQRKATVEGLGLRLKENVALGLSIEQAKNAAKALGRLAGETPLERIKKAARLQATLGAMGIAGGERAAEIIRLGQRATPEQRRELEAILQQAAGAAAEARVGGLAQEITTAALVERTGLQDLLGKDSPFVTTTSEALKPQEGILKNTASLGSESSWIGQSLKAIQQAIMVVSSPIIGAVTGIGGTLIKIFELLALYRMAGGIGGLLGRGAVTGPAGGLMGKIFSPGGFAAGATTAPGGAAGKVTGGLMSRVAGGTVGRFLGGTVGALGGPLGIALGTMAGSLLGELISSAITPEEPRAVDMSTIERLMGEMHITFKSIDRNTDTIASNTKFIREILEKQVEVGPPAPNRQFSQPTSGLLT